MSERIPPIDEEGINRANIIIFAPAGYPLIAAVDTRNSIHSPQTITHLPLEDTLVPCAQMPGLQVPQYTEEAKRSLSQLINGRSEAVQDIFIKLVSSNMTDHLNQQRVGIEYESAQDAKPYICLIGSFTYLAGSEEWLLIRDTVRTKAPGHLLTDLEAFVQKQVVWENDIQNYITGENGSFTLWENRDN